MHHKSVLPCEPAWTTTAVSLVDQFLPPWQLCCSCFLISTSRTKQRSVDAVIPAMEEEEEEVRAFGGSVGRGTTTTTNTMATDMAKDRSGGGGTGGGGAGLLPGIYKDDNDSNMNARKRANNRSKNAAKANTKTGVGGKVGGLDADLGWATNFLAGRQFDIFVDFEGGSSDKNYPGS